MSNLKQAVWCLFRTVLHAASAWSTKNDTWTPCKQTSPHNTDHEHAICEHMQFTGPHASLFGVHCCIWHCDMLWAMMWHPPWWQLSVAVHLPVARSQTRMYVSTPTTTCFPFGLNAQLQAALKKSAGTALHRKWVVAGQQGKNTDEMLYTFILF